MNLLRNTLKANFSQIPNELIIDLSISSGALRVLLYLFTKPDGWNVYNLDICKNLNISEKTLTKYWKELLNSVWLKRKKSIDKDGQFTGGYTYQIGHFIRPDIFTKSEESGGHSNNKLQYKQVTNNNTENTSTKESDISKKDNSVSKPTKKERLEKIITYMRAHCKYKSKIKSTKDFEEKVFKLKDINKFVIRYIDHQKEKSEFSQTIGNFMLDYDEDTYEDKDSSLGWK
jgi:hypothetical protein